MILSILIWIEMILNRANLALIITGWIQFALLSLLITLPLLLLLIVLLSPIKYIVKGRASKVDRNMAEEKNERKKQLSEMLESVHIQGNIKVSWLSSLICGSAIVEDKKLSWKGRIFLKKINSEEATKASESKQEAKVISESKEDAKIASESKQEAKVISESKEDAKIASENRKDAAKVSEVKKEITKTIERKKDATKASERKEDFTKEKEAGKAQSILKKISDGYEKIREKMEYTFGQIYDKINGISEVKEKGLEFIFDEIHREAATKLLKAAKKLLKSIRPKKIKGKLKIGFENPRTTGLFFAGASCLSPHLGDDIHLEGDFDEEALEADVYIQGKLRLGSLVWFLLRLVLYKCVRITIMDIWKMLLKKQMKGA